MPCGAVILTFRDIVHRISFVVQFNRDKRSRVLNLPYCKIEGTTLGRTCGGNVTIVRQEFYKLLFHSLFKVEFDIDHYVLGEHRER